MLVKIHLIIQMSRQKTYKALNKWINDNGSEWIYHFIHSCNEEKQTEQNTGMSDAPLSKMGQDCQEIDWCVAREGICQS